MSRFFCLLFAATLFLCLDVFAVRSFPQLPDFYVFFIFVVGTAIYGILTSNDSEKNYLACEGDFETCEDIVRTWGKMAAFTAFVLLCFAVGLGGMFLMPADQLFGFVFGSMSSLFGILITKELIA